MDPRYDVVGIGNAIVDVLAQSTDAQLAQLGLTKGAMTLIDMQRADELYRAMGPGLECSGGSAANTVHGLASLGGRGAYIGRVRDDQLGEVFRHDMHAAGVHYGTPPATSGPTTARCLIFVTPDAQRTLQTFLGASADLGPDEVDAGVVTAARITYLEGYLWDPPAAKQAFLKAARLAHEAGRKVALSLSDAFCVARHRESFLDLVEHHVDILFANETEILSLYQAQTFDEALQHVRAHCEVAALTRGEKGSVVFAGGEVHELAAQPDVHVVDTTGAGDLYAAGFLHGYCQGKHAAECGRMGGLAAAEVISHFGARPETSLKQLMGL